jgi:hypothetical protein
MPGAAAAAGIVLAGGVAGAQTKPPVKYKPQPLLLQKEQLGTERLVNVGRTRMRSGDCAGALEAFDEVLRTAVAPSANRDRGLCHEQLGHSFPAIDDYRAYLTAEPDAPDADGIRQRLVALEEQATGHSSASSSDVPDDATAVAAGASVDGSGAPAILGKAARRDKMDSLDRDDDREQRSSLRRGKGWGFAPFFAEHKWFSSESSFGDSSTWSECVGMQFRYSFGTSALMLEAGYEHYNTTNIDAATLSGLTSLVAFEFRVPLDQDYDNQLLLAPGVGYQHRVVVPTDPQFQSTSAGAFVPRVRLGYRRMLDAAVALDVALDFGVTKYFAYEKFPFDSSEPTQELVALGVAVLWGL